MEHNSIVTSVTTEEKQEVPKEKSFEIVFSAPKPKKSIQDLENKILFGFKHASKSISQENYQIYRELLESDKMDPQLLNLFKKINSKYRLLSTQRTVILVFEDDSDVAKFNDLVLESKIKQFLDSKFLKEYLWIALNMSDFNKYISMAKEKTNSELSEDIVFDTSKKSKVFRELMEILEDN